MGSPQQGDEHFVINNGEHMKVENSQPKEVVYSPEELRTSSNNMLCTVVYEPLPQDQQEEVDLILQVAN